MNRYLMQYFRCQYFAFDRNPLPFRVAYSGRRRQRGALADGGEVQQDFQNFRRRISWIGLICTDHSKVK